MNQKSLDKKKTKKLDWEKEFNKWWKERFGEQYVGTYPQGDFKEFIKQTLTQQRTELLDEIKNGLLSYPKLIKETRNSLGESKDVFGKRFNVPRASIRYYELGTYEAPYRVIYFCQQYKLEQLFNLLNKKDE